MGDSEQNRRNYQITTICCCCIKYFRRFIIIILLYSLSTVITTHTKQNCSIYDEILYSPLLFILISFTLVVSFCRSFDRICFLLLLSISLYKYIYKLCVTYNKLTHLFLFSCLFAASLCCYCRCWCCYSFTLCSRLNKIAIVLF